jgi:hypothetical protein
MKAESSFYLLLNGTGASWSLCTRKGKENKKENENLIVPSFFQTRRLLHPMIITNRCNHEGRGGR